MKDLAEVLAQIATRPESQWAELVAARWKDDPALQAQAMIWLRTNRERVDDDDVTPVLAGDRYELGVLLDVGGSASVWQARDNKLDRNVAVKVFRGERSPVVDEILAEARAAAEVASDHVVRVLDVHDADPPYIVMELVGEWEPRRGVLAPGGSAAAVRPRSQLEAVRWVRDVARGVHDAHLRNVFHRDLKPHNVLITPFSRRARIADFGLAISEASTAENALEIAGTPGYIAPEQAAGLSPNLDPHDLTDRAVLVALDVWGLGALAFDLVTGEPPWQADAGLEAWERAAVAVESPKLAGDVPKRLRRILDKALAIDPKLRYATAGELADDLDSYLARVPTSHDRSRWSHLKLWMRRNPQLAVTVVLAAVLATISVVAYMNVVEVRTQRNALAVEAEQTQAENTQLMARSQKTRENLAATETELSTKAKELEELRTRLADADKEYEAIVAAKERALRDADAATKQLADQLAAMRGERDEARVAQKLYEGFWTRARAESAESTKERDSAQKDRDTARSERDAAQHERQIAIAARDAAEEERDKALADRDRAEAVRRRIEADLARVTAELAAVRPHPIRDREKSKAAAAAPIASGSGSGSAAPRPAAPVPVKAPSPTAKVATHGPDAPKAAPAPHDGSGAPTQHDGGAPPKTPATLLWPAPAPPAATEPAADPKPSPAQPEPAN